MKKTFRALILIVLIAAAWHYRAPLAALAHRIMQPESPHQIINQASVLRQIQDLNRLESTAYHIDTIIKTEKQGNWYALWQDSQKGIFTARGSVVAGLDLNRLSERNIQILDNQTIIINLPPVEILAVQLDNIDVYDIRTGALNLYQADLNVLGEVQYHAKRQILRQACADQILQRAAERSKNQIEQLFALTPLKVSVYTPAALPECKLAARAQASQAQR